MPDPTGPFETSLLQVYTATDLIIPPLYFRAFFNIVKDVMQNSLMNPIHMFVNQRYSHLFEMNMIMGKVVDEGRGKR